LTPSSIVVWHQCFWRKYIFRDGRHGPTSFLNWQAWRCFCCSQTGCKQCGQPKPLKKRRGWKLVWDNRNY